MKSAERKSGNTHAGRDETDRQAVIENTESWKWRSSPKGVRGYEGGRWTGEGKSLSGSPCILTCRG